MEPDYLALGFKAGIEIHQELNTAKLFCDCSSSLKEEQLLNETKRKIRAVAGETGNIDSASAYEQLRDRFFIYNSYSSESCLVELDEEPPHEVCKDAFRTALGFAKLLKLKVPDTICVMRKTVTDGSAVSGFQRTMLVAYEGPDSFLDTSKGKVKITQLNLEEDSSKIIKKEGNDVYYSLSRLGIPLLEIGTDASLKDPAHVKEAALEIGTLLRSFNVRRGIGSIRQDVNISISGGARIEVKGWQDLKKLEDLVKNEVLRQYNLLEIKKYLGARGLKKFEMKSKDVTDLFDKTESKIISDLISDKGRVIALSLPEFSGLLKKEICPGKTFGRELSEYAKAYGTKGMIHTDEDLSKYKLEKEFSEIRQVLKAKNEDLLIIIAGKEETALKATESVYSRALYCLKGIPEETRIPNHNDATSSYARPLPGAHRLYPETDIPNIPIDKSMLDSVELPELIKNKISRLEKQYGLNPSISKEIIREGFMIDDYIKKFRNLEPKFIARVLIEMPKEIFARHKKEIDISPFIDELLAKVDEGKISRDAIFEILEEISAGKEIDFSKYTRISDQDLEKEIRKIIREFKDIPENALIGKAMGKLRGKADGEKIVQILRMIISKKDY